MIAASLLLLCCATQTAETFRYRVYPGIDAKRQFAKGVVTVKCTGGTGNDLGKAKHGKIFSGVLIIYKEQKFIITTPQCFGGKESSRDEYLTPIPDPTNPRKSNFKYYDGRIEIHYGSIAGANQRLYVIMSNKVNKTAITSANALMSMKVSEGTDGHQELALIQMTTECQKQFNVSRGDIGPQYITIGDEHESLRPGAKCVIAGWGKSTYSRRPGGNVIENTNPKPKFAPKCMKQAEQLVIHYTGELNCPPAGRGSPYNAAKAFKQQLCLEDKSVSPNIAEPRDVGGAVWCLPKGETDLSKYSFTGIITNRDADTEPKDKLFTSTWTGVSTIDVIAKFIQRAKAGGLQASNDVCWISPPPTPKPIKKGKGKKKNG